LCEPLDDERAHLFSRSGSAKTSLILAILRPVSR
jgi:hypothetical protein